MAQSPRLGTKVRALRRRTRMTQVELASRLEISASYLNLIEHNRRALTAPLLIKLASVFDFDVSSFAADDDARLVADLHEIFGDEIFDDALTSADLREFADGSPVAAKAVVQLYQRYREAQSAAQSLAERLTDGEEVQGFGHGQLPTEEVSEFIQRYRNHWPNIEDAAEGLEREARLTQEHLGSRLSDYLEARHGVRSRVVTAKQSRGAARRLDLQRGELQLSELLPPRSRHFQLAHQIALLTYGDLLDELVNDPVLTTETSRRLGRVALANYFAGAVLMPYAAFLQAARSERYDVEVLGNRFRTSFEQVCHRLTTLQRKGSEGVPFHFLRVDVAGNISKRFSASGIRFARFSGACPRWNVYSAFMTPERISIQISRMTNGTTYFCIARTISKGRGGYHATHPVHVIGLGCEIKHARKMVYSDGIDLENLDLAVPVGTTCRMCDRLDCDQRAFPPLQHRLNVDENVRGVSFYAPAED